MHLNTTYNSDTLLVLRNSDKEPYTESQNGYSLRVEYSQNRSYGNTLGESEDTQFNKS